MSEIVEIYCLRDELMEGFDGCVEKSWGYDGCKLRDLKRMRDDELINDEEWKFG